MIISWLTAFNMSYSVRAAIDAPVSASISTPVLPAQPTVQSTSSALHSLAVADEGGKVGSEAEDGAMAWYGGAE